MSYDVVFGKDFEKSIKRYLKRYRNVKDDVKKGVEQLLENPLQGDLISRGYGTRKLRIRNSNLRRGKSGSYRLIYYVQDNSKAIYLLLLYAKSDRGNVPSSELKTLLKEILD